MSKNRELFKPFVIMIVSAILTVVTIGTGLTVAYLKDSDEEVNHVSAGETVIDVCETFPPADCPPEPGETVTKVVRIANTGNLTCTVRARILFTDDVLAGMTEPLETGDNWQEGQYGFYYYMIPVKPGEETEPLITGVRFRTDYEGGGEVTAEDIARIESGLIVYSEALEFGGDPDSYTAQEILSNWNGY